MARLLCYVIFVDFLFVAHGIYRIIVGDHFLFVELKKVN